MARKKETVDKSDNLNLALFAPKTTWVAPGQFPNLSDIKEIGADIESYDPKLKTKGPGFIRGDASVVGVSLACDDMAWYFPFGHLGGGNLDKSSVVRYLTDVFKAPSDKVFANAPYDLEGLSSLGIKVAGKIYDVQINEALLNEEREDGYDLNTLCRLHLGTFKDESLLREAASAYNIDPKSGLWKLPAKYVGQYAEYDALSTLKIFHKQKTALAKEDLNQIFDLETRLIPVLFAMRMQGVKVDMDAAEQLSKSLDAQELTLRNQLFKEYGKINDQSGMDLAKVCDRLKIIYPRTDAGNPSFEGEWLEAHDHPFLKSIAEIRQLSKNKTDYVDKILTDSIRGRLHIQWKQLVSDDGGARTGRIAAGNPPLQQFPASKKRNGKPNLIGQAIRGLLISDTGKWLKGDYSQQEPRVLIHFAALCRLPGADAAAFAYRANPKQDFYSLIMEICKKERRPSKTLYLSVTYGQGLKAFSAEVGVSQDVGKAMRDEFNERLPFIHLLAEKCMRLASTRGYIKTLCGRKRHFNYWEPTDAFQMRERKYQLQRERKLTPDLARELDTTPRELEAAQKQWPEKQIARAMCHKALNALCQASSADMMKAGLVKGYEEDKRVPYITVHDEIGGGVTDEDDSNKWIHTMESCVTMCIPVKMDAHIGKSWK